MNVMHAPAPPVMSERRVTIICALMVAIGPVAMAMFTPAMPEIVRHFGSTDAAVKLTLSFYFAGFAFAQLICGPLSDALGRKPVALAFLGLFTLTSLLAMLAPTLEMLIVARFMQGIGASAGIAVARAVVRDLYTGERSARIMNVMAIILGLGPVLSPTVGGFAVEHAGWQAIFGIMTLGGAIILLIVRAGLRETVPRDMSRLRPRALAASYRLLLGNRYFMASSLVMAGTIGALYTQATILPFVMMDQVGFTPMQFGLGMLMQSGLFFLGSVVVLFVIGPIGAFRLVPFGLAFIAAGCVLIATVHRLADPSFATVMGPVAVYSFGIAFVMPAMMTAALAPLPRHAGAAAALSGFMQMGTGMVGGLVASLIGDPVTALSTVIPCLGGLAILSWLVFRRLPEPPGATVTRDTPPV